MIQYIHVIYLAPANQRHIEYLPYPDWNLIEECDERCQGIHKKDKENNFLLTKFRW